MAAVINTNYLSLVAQNNLNKSQSALGSAIERLSSGLRINSAKDDAAGQAIANRFTANVKGLTQAARNANDGISIAQTTEGALNEINNNLQRIRELTVQAVNGTNSDTDLDSIQAEIQQRKDEIDRVSQQTQFNGVRVLDNDVESKTIQVGANDGETITINLRAINTTTLKLDQFTVAKGIDVSKVGATAPATAEGPTVDADTSGFTKPGDQDGTFGPLLSDGAGNYLIEYSGDGQDATVGGFYAVTADDDGTLNLDTLQAGEDGTGYTATATVPTTVTIDTGDPDAANLRAYSGTNANDPAYVVVDNTSGEDVYYAATVDADGKIARGKQLNVGDPTANPLAALDDALADVDSLRSDLGAIQNRFESTIANLNNTVNTLSAARSRIEDADYATEVSNMTKAQILQQAGTSVLAQANQVPQTVLSLLR